MSKILKISLLIGLLFGAQEKVHAAAPTEKYVIVFEICGFDRNGEFVLGSFVDTEKNVTEGHTIQSKIYVIFDAEQFYALSSEQQAELICSELNNKIHEFFFDDWVCNNLSDYFRMSFSNDLYVRPPIYDSVELLCKKLNNRIRLCFGLYNKDEQEDDHQKVAHYILTRRSADRSYFKIRPIVPPYASLYKQGKLGYFFKIQSSMNKKRSTVNAPVTNVSVKQNLSTQENFNKNEALNDLKIVISSKISLLTSVLKKYFSKNNNYNYKDTFYVV